MGTTTGPRGRFRRLGQQEATRLVAIRTIVEAAGTDEDTDVLAEALLVLGASEQEIAVAMFGTPG
jgi:hypothetical protein